MASRGRLRLPPESGAALLWQIVGEASRSEHVDEVILFLIILSAHVICRHWRSEIVLAKRLVSLHLDLFGINNFVVVTLLLLKLLFGQGLLAHCLVEAWSLFVSVDLISRHCPHVDLVIIALSEAQIHAIGLCETLLLASLIALEAAKEKAASKSHTKADSYRQNSNEGVDDVFSLLVELFVNFSDLLLLVLNDACQLRQFLHNLCQFLESCIVTILEESGRGHAF